MPTHSQLVLQWQCARLPTHVALPGTRARPRRPASQQQMEPSVRRSFSSTGGSDASAGARGQMEVAVCMFCLWLSIPDYEAIFSHHRFRCQPINAACLKLVDVLHQNVEQRWWYQEENFKNQAQINRLYRLEGRLRAEENSGWRKARGCRSVGQGQEASSDGGACHLKHACGPLKSVQKCSGFRGSVLAFPPRSGLQNWCTRTWKREQSCAYSPSSCNDALAILLAVAIGIVQEYGTCTIHLPPGTPDFTSLVKGHLALVLTQMHTQADVERILPTTKHHHDHHNMPERPHNDYRAAAPNHHHWQFAKRCRAASTEAAASVWFHPRPRLCKLFMLQSNFVLSLSAHIQPAEQDTNKLMDFGGFEILQLHLLWHDLSKLTFWYSSYPSGFRQPDELSHASLVLPPAPTTCIKLGCPQRIALGKPRPKMTA